MSKGKGKLYSPQKPANEKIYDEKKKITGIRIGITYLDRNRYGFKDLFNASRGNSSYIQDLNGFILRARQLNDIGEFIKTFASHIRTVNDDELSKAKIQRLQEKYNLEVDHLIHVHCKSGGKGEFVVHGFQIDNVFEIVWLDPKHDVHS